MTPEELEPEPVDWVTLWRCDGPDGLVSVLPIVNEHILGQVVDWDDLSTIKCWGAIKIGSIADGYDT